MPKGIGYPMKDKSKGTATKKKVVKKLYRKKKP